MGFASLQFGEDAQKRNPRQFRDTVGGPLQFDRRIMSQIDFTDPLTNCREERLLDARWADMWNRSAPTCGFWSQVWVGCIAGRLGFKLDLMLPSRVEM